MEGHELAVLEGYRGSLLGAEIEVNFHPFRRDVPLFDEVMAHMRQRGFMLVDLRRTFWTPRHVTDIRNFSAKGFLVHGDALFVVDPFVPVNYDVLATSDARARYLALLCVYGYAAEAMMAIDALEESNIMPSVEAAARREAVATAARRRKLPTPRIGRILLVLERMMGWPVAVAGGLFMSMFSQSDRQLGN